MRILRLHKSNLSVQVFAIVELAIQRIAHTSGLVVNGTFDAGLKNAFIFAENSGTGRQAGQGGLKKPADELRLARSSGFRQNAVRVAARRRLGDFEFCGGGKKPAAANDFAKDAGLGNGQPETSGKALNLGAEARGGIDDEDGRGGRVDIEDRRRAVGGERDDMGEKRRAIFAAA